MAMALEGVRDFLRRCNDWDVDHCEIQQKGTIPGIARGFYVTLDDRGIETGPDDNHYLKEIYTIEIGIWTETASLSPDMSGNAQLKSDKYIKGATTLDDLERTLARQLHHKNEPRNQINEQFGLPGTDGDIFLQNLIWKGRPGNEIQGVPQGSQNNVGQWLGRREIYRGFTRNQNIGCVQ